MHDETQMVWLYVRVCVRVCAGVYSRRLSYVMGSGSSLCLNLALRSWLLY